jgi:hypothetical protein
MTMQPDLAHIRKRFQGLSEDALLAELALPAEDFVPEARTLLEEEARSRGIKPEDVAAFQRRAAGGTPVIEPGGMVIVATIEGKELAGEVAAYLIGNGLEVAVRETEAGRLRVRGHQPGERSVWVAERDAAEAGRLLDRFSPSRCADSCGSGCGCGSAAAPAEKDDLPQPGEWPEDGDWWKTGQAGEGDADDEPDAGKDSPRR